MRRRPFPALAALPLLAILSLGACAAPPAPQETYYRLDPGPPARHFAHPLLPGTLEIERVQTESVLADRAMVFESAPGALRRYHYDFWSDAPGLMLRDTLAHALGAAGAADSVTTPTLRQPPDWLLQAQLERFEQNPERQTVAMRLRVAIIPADGSGPPRLLATYAADSPTDGTQPAAAAAAMNRAMADIVTHVLDDLAHAPPIPPAP